MLKKWLGAALVVLTWGYFKSQAPSQCANCCVLSDESFQHVNGASFVPWPQSRPPQLHDQSYLADFADFSGNRSWDVVDFSSIR